MTEPAEEKVRVAIWATKFTEMWGPFPCGEVVDVDDPTAERWAVSAFTGSYEKYLFHKQYARRHAALKMVERLVD